MHRYIRIGCKIGLNGLSISTGSADGIYASVCFATLATGKALTG